MIPLPALASLAEQPLSLEGQSLWTQLLKTVKEKRGYRRSGRNEGPYRWAKTTTAGRNSGRREKEKSLENEILSKKADCPSLASKPPKPQQPLKVMPVPPPKESCLGHVKSQPSYSFSVRAQTQSCDPCKWWWGEVVPALPSEEGIARKDENKIVGWGSQRAKVGALATVQKMEQRPLEGVRWERWQKGSRLLTYTWARETWRKSIFQVQFSKQVCYSLWWQRWEWGRLYWIDLCILAFSYSFHPGIFESKSKLCPEKTVKLNISWRPFLTLEKNKNKNLQWNEIHLHAVATFKILN